MGCRAGGRRRRPDATGFGAENEPAASRPKKFSLRRCTMFQKERRVESMERKTVETEKAPKAYAAPRLVLIGRAAELVQGGFYGDDSDYNYGLGWYHN